jgi:hypothetical protein
LLDCVESSDARLFLPAAFGAVEVASDEGFCGSGVCVPFMGVLLS